MAIEAKLKITIIRIYELEISHSRKLNTNINLVLKYYKSLTMSHNMDKQPKGNYVNILRIQQLKL